MAREREPEAYPIHYIDKPLGIFSTEVIDNICLSLACEDRLDQRDDLVRDEGTTNYLSAGRLFGIHNGGRLGYRIHR